MADDQALNTDTVSPSRPILRRNAHDRLSIEFPHRIAASITAGLFSGFLMGSLKGSQDMSFVFRAENAHRLPTTQTGWFLYHKSKNYNMMFGGLKEGGRRALQLGFFTALYFLLEEGVDRGRAFAARQTIEWRQRRTVTVQEEMGLLENQRDAISSICAGMGAGGMFAVWSRLPMATVARTARMGAVVGGIFGLAQDGLSILSGRKVGYVELVKWMAGSGRKDTEADIPV